MLFFFSPRSAPPLQEVCAVKTRRRGCILAALLATAVAPLTTSASDIPHSPPTHSWAEPQGKDAAGEKIPIKDEKYDVNHIGQRGVGRGFNLYSPKREGELGESLAASFDHTTKIIRDPAINDYINKLAQKIVRYSDADVPFTVKVIDSSDVPRAYGLPGGFLYVDSALILAADGEAELAGVLAHEIAHVAARHATRALTRKRMYNIVNSVALFAGPAGVALEDVGGIAGPLSLKKFSRESEYEADLLGIEYAYAAGYDPEALLAALEKLHAIEVKRTSAFAKVPGYHLASKIPFHSKIARGFASYPLTEERIHRLQLEIPAFLPNRTDYIVDTNDFEEVKSMLLANQAPLLRHHGSDGDNEKGPVLRRAPEGSSPQENSEMRSLDGLALLPH